MGKKFLIDTNILIEYVGDLLPKEANNFISEIIDENFLISIINKIEILGHQSVDQKVEDFISLAESILISNDIVKTTISLRKRHKIKLPDAIIAATAIENDLIILTRNTKDFIIIKDLEVVNPHEISSN